jgi:hypothetical protein
MAEKVFRCKECNDEYDDRDFRLLKKEGVTDFYLDRKAGIFVCHHCCRNADDELKEFLKI